MTPARTLVEELAALASRFGGEHRKEKLRRLERLSAIQIREPVALLRLHECLCFLQAYPDDAEVLARVDDALDAVPARVARLSAAARERLRASGIAGTELHYPFGYPMARWLATRFPRDAEIAWPRFTEGGRLEELLPLLVTHAESEAFSEGGLGWRAWLTLCRRRHAAGGGRRRWSGLQALLDVFEHAGLEASTRDAFYEGLRLPVRWTLRGRASSRTFARLPWRAPFFHADDGLRRSGIDLAAEIARPFPPLRRATPALAGALIEAARAAMATRARELYAFSYPNPEDVLTAEPGRGLSIALVGLAPDSRLPVEAYYAFFALKNGVPVGYGGGWGMFGTVEFALNIFESFRQGESALIIAQVLRAYRRVFRAHTVVVDRSQIGHGHGNEEALRSGAFYFYRRLGFRPIDPDVERLALEEEAKAAAGGAGYRSPVGVLKRLARSDLALPIDPGRRAPRVTPAAIAALVTRRIAETFDGDRRAAVRADSSRVARVLGASARRHWLPEERRAFERFAMVAALIPDLDRWPEGDRRRLLAIMRARGGPSEHRYLRALDAHRRLRAGLEALAVPR